MAEGLAKSIWPKGIEIESAGTIPSKVNPLAIEVMNEIGIDLSKQYSKSPDNLPPCFFIHLDYVITLCAEEVCPVLISDAKKLH
jgi:arsenate reductase